MSVRIVTAGAGTGKTHRLMLELEAALDERGVDPRTVLATTFTAHAAAELIERARMHLLRAGRTLQAEQLLAARVGTVNAVSGQLVSEFALALGISPDVRVLDDEAADLELRRTLARVVSDEVLDELAVLGVAFGAEQDWRGDVRQIVDAARSNRLSSAALSESASRSIDELDVCLGPVTRDDLDDTLSRAIDVAIAAIIAGDDETKGTRAYVERLRATRASTELPWSGWASLAKERPTKASLPAAAPVFAVAARHVEHPRLRAQLKRRIALTFEIAACCLAAYQDHKRGRRLIDFVDQEALALEVLERPSLRADLAGEISLVLVDEFQDTSPLQLALFLALSRIAPRSLWVGDPKQAIYGFRGTDPALMDAAIEALTGPTDPELVAATVGVQARLGNVEMLATSYRSRPSLVAFTNAVFGPAFEVCGTPSSRTVLASALEQEAAALGEPLEHWPIDLDRAAGTHNDDGRAAALAGGVRGLLLRETFVRDREAKSNIRRATARDLAVLCRTNNQCQLVADALAHLGVAAIVPRMGLMATPEGQVARAALALLVDPHDALAAAELTRLVAYPDSLDKFVDCALGSSEPGIAAFREVEVVAKVLHARPGARDRGAVAMLEAAIEAVELRMLCAAWGHTSVRLANLDALRAHATTYTSEAAASGRVATPAGLLAYLEDLAPRYTHWAAGPTDRRAVPVGDDAVTISTWHRAKGLEWPLVVLYGLESLRVPSSFGVHVLDDRDAIDLDDPLGSRWIRMWPNPYATSNQLGGVREAVERSARHGALRARAEHEALRLLYVGWTRAKDRLVLAAQRGKLFDGLLGVLRRAVRAVNSKAQFEEPVGEGIVGATFADHQINVRVVPLRYPSQSAPPAPAPARIAINVNHPPNHYPSARLLPSTLSSPPCMLGEVVVLGGRLHGGASAGTEAFGDAYHAFLAADDLALERSERLDISARLMAEHCGNISIDAAQLVEASDRLWQWIESRFGKSTVHREWPFEVEVSGSSIIGMIDMMVIGTQAAAVIDHKTFPGIDFAARSTEHAGQLFAYQEAVRCVTTAPISLWVHFPLLGRLQELRRV